MQASFLPAVTSPDLVVGVVGCGVMGRGIVQIAALAGAQVRMFDARPGAASAARDGLLETFTMLLQKGRLDQARADSTAARILTCDRIEDLSGCHVVIEAIVEDLAIKRALFAQLEGIAGPDAILASNTSSLQVTSIAAGLTRPERVGGFHFFNPVPLMKLVEVIGGLRTDPAVVDYLLALGRHWGHTAVRAKDTPGFIVNHAGRGFSTEGMRVLYANVTDVQNLDNILRDCAGFKLGPCELMDLTGVDVSHPVMESIYHQYYEEPRYRPQPLTRSMLSAGMLGRKTGQGFYRYDSDNKKQTVAEAAPSALLPPSVWLSRARPELAERIATLVSAAGVLLEDSERPSANALCIVTPLGDDATQCCAREGLDGSRTVGVDALFDMSRRRVVMTTPATSEEYREMARGLFGLNGCLVSVIRDSTGLVCQRVVAHIVNIACEIAQQGIAEPQDIDNAVKLGLGYPHGPLAWGDLLGANTVVTILNNLDQLNGDGRYRPSAWLQRRAMLGLSLLKQEA
ncbi:3-hydroxyacyl-CoA dehydrogenase [Lacisediminimonas profundi]|uniref:3-hydroxyacyl-CoA dehydrogenase n=1 Tax=Lacisediminimonas profundi TaxID=2603856 RepID=UPI00124BA61E|nr:3-hydroxyacyl-CoA dehydrogenase [Lacisediminimonas profundi]